MARIRTIKPEFWTDPFLVQLEPLGRLMFMALLTCADDHGFIQDEPERIALEVMPREDPLQVDHWMQLFETSGKLERYVGPDGENFLKVKNWEKHQRVDRPSQSKIFREGSRKLAIPQETRRAVAERHGCEPGGEVDASCYYCGAPGRVYWAKLRNGRPSGWVTFPGLELDHLDPESNGGENGPENIVLACRSCNRSKGTQHWIDFFSKRHDVDLFAMARDPSRGVDAERKGKEGKGEEGKEEKAGSTPAIPAAPDGDGRSARASPHTIPDDWQPNEANREWLTKAGLSPAQQEEVIDEFRRWARNSGHRKSNWDLAFSRNPAVKSAVGRARTKHQSAPSVAASFEGKEYEGTPDEELPAWGRGG